MPGSCRCQFRNITNNYVCKSKSKNLNYIFGKRACMFHFNYYAKHAIIIIQKHYRGYKCRKYLNNFYKKLPFDVQKIINFYIREDHYAEIYNKVIKKIVTKKINSFNAFMDYNTFQYTDYIFRTRFDMLSEFIMFIHENYPIIEKNFKLFQKYKNILCYTKTIKYPAYQQVIYDKNLDNLFCYKNKIKNAVSYYEKNIFNAYSSHLFDVTYALSQRLNKICEDLYSLDTNLSSFS